MSFSTSFVVPRFKRGARCITIENAIYLAGKRKHRAGMCVEFERDRRTDNVEIFSQELHESLCGTHVRDIEHA